MRIPNQGGLVFNFTWGRTLRGGKGHMFGLECVCTFLEEKGFCASCCVDEYMKKALKLGWEFDKGFLFSDAKKNKRIFGQVKQANLTHLLKSYLVQLDIFDNETMQSF